MRAWSCSSPCPPNCVLCRRNIQSHTDQRPAHRGNSLTAVESQDHEHQEDKDGLTRISTVVTKKTAWKNQPRPPTDVASTSHLLLPGVFFAPLPILTPLAMLTRLAILTPLASLHLVHCWGRQSTAIVETATATCSDSVDELKPYRCKCRVVVSKCSFSAHRLHASATLTRRRTCTNG